MTLDAVNDELHRATDKFPPFNSAHEGYAVILEELDELWEEIKGEASPSRMREEAIQVAAMAVRFVYDVCGDLSILAAGSAQHVVVHPDGAREVVDGPAHEDSPPRSIDQGATAVDAVAERESGNQDSVGGSRPTAGPALPGSPSAVAGEADA